MYKRMLVLLDGSKLAEVVFSYAQELAGRLNLDIDLLNVCSPQETGMLPMREAYMEHMAEIMRAGSEAVQEKAGIKPGKKPINARGKVITGYPPEEILKYADENKIDIIMLSTRGSSGVTRWGLGGVADKVIHESKVPIWLVPSELREDIIYDKMPKNIIMLPLDGSPVAEAVIPHVLELAKQRGAETEILLVSINNPLPTTGPVGMELLRENTRVMKSSTERYLKEIVERFEKAGLKTRAENLVGDPAEEIVRYAAEHQPRLIAMSTHGRSGFTKFVFGSVTENVLRRLRRTPVFLVKP